MTVATDEHYFRAGRPVKVTTKAPGHQAKDAPEAWQPVTSSNIKAIAFIDGKGLAVWFGGQGKAETVYYYPSCPRRKYTAMLSAPSKGVYLAKHVKGIHPHDGPHSPPT